MNEGDTSQVEPRHTPLSDRLALRPKEAAAALGLNERTLRKWMRDEGLPFFRLDRGIFIPRSDLERWMSRRIETQHSADEIARDILRDI